MTRKDFEKFANMFAGEMSMAKHLARYAPDKGGEARVQQVRNIILSTADIFAQSNDRFDRAKFYKASGLEMS